MSRHGPVPDLGLYYLPWPPTRTPANSEAPYVVELRFQAGAAKIAFARLKTDFAERATLGDEISSSGSGPPDVVMG
jgi:hypothetical protein